LLISLQRKIDIESYKAIIELGRNEARDDIISVLMLAQEHDGKITPELICQELLANRPKKMGELIIKRCKELELFDNENYLTELGKISIDSKEVFLFERGLFEITCTKDPLLPQVILDLKPQARLKLSQELSAERRARENSSESFEDVDVQELPQWLTQTEGSIVDLLGNSKDRVLIKKIEKMGQSIPAGSSHQLQGEIKIEDNGSISFSISGRFNGKLPAPELNFQDVWRVLLGEKSKNWDESTSPPKLRLRLGELNETEINSFKKDIEFTEPSLPNYGTFETTIVRGVPIGPETQKDAEQWGEKLLKSRLSVYQFKKVYQNLIKEIASKFPKFKISLPSRTDLAISIRQKFVRGRVRLPEYYWFLQAPLDLNPGGKIIE